MSLMIVGGAFAATPVATKQVPQEHKEQGPKPKHKKHHHKKKHHNAPKPAPHA